MLNRRSFSALAAALTGASFAGAARAADAGIALYDSTGPDLTIYGLDTATAQAALIRRGQVRLPANVQYAWPHPDRQFLYVAASNGVPGPAAGGYGASGDHHFAAAFRVTADGTLEPHGETVKLKYRPIHISIDYAGHFALIAYNNPSGLTVHRIGIDGTLGEEVPQPLGLDFGIYAHQVRATPSNRTVALVTRGNDAAQGKPEDPGAIKLFTFTDGLLAPLASIAPPAGISFGPRHLDFHPTLPRVYVSLERQNSLWVYGLQPDGGFSAAPLFQKVSLLDPDAKGKYPGQTAGPVHVHPNGRFVYQTNRGSGTLDYDGQKVWNGGENNIAVYAIDRKTGAPSLIQHIDSRGFEPRTFTINPEGTMLVVANQVPLLVHDKDGMRRESASMAFYRIGADGKLTFLRKQDVDTTDGTQFWCGTLTMP